MSNCPEGYLDLTSQIDAYGSIPNYGCKNDRTVSAIWIPNTVRSIGIQAFYDCENLERIEFEDGGDAGLSIGLMAFENCSKLREVKFPKRFSSIGAACFRGCSALGRIEFNGGDSVFREPGYVFDGCPQKDALRAALRTECERRLSLLMQKKETVNQRRTKTKEQVPLQAIELIKDLDKLIREHNPWTELSEKMEKMVGQSWDEGFTNDSDVRFALDADVEKIKEYNNKIRSGRSKGKEVFLLKVDDQQPIPFIGHPEAKVWVLAMNPYYNPLEWCTFIKWDDYETRIKLQHGAKARPELRKFFEERQRLYVKSLNFSNEKDKRFYILDESMHVFEGDGNKDWTGYLWYGRHYLPDKETAYFQGDKKLVIASKELFALEYLPYPSTAFGDNYPIFQHATFWAKLVKFALHNDKILIVRGRIMELVRRVDPEKFEEARKEGRILKFFNPQQISITRDNVGEYGARELEAYCDKLGK